MQTIEELRARIDELEEQVRQLKESIKHVGPLPDGMPQFTNMQEAIIRTLMSGKMVRKSAIIASAVPDYVDDPDMYLKVYICKIRKKLEGTPFAIENFHGRGYLLTGIEIDAATEAA